MSPSVKKNVPKIRIEETDQLLTSQAGLIPVIHFMNKKIRLRHLFNEIIKHERSPNAVYQLCNLVEMLIIGFIGGSFSFEGIKTVWSDPVLQKTAGFNFIPDTTTMSRMFKELPSGMEHEFIILNHMIRDKLGISKGKTIMLDVDSTVSTVYGNQEGAEKGYNPHKKGAKSYHPILGFDIHTKGILQGILRCGSAFTSNNIIGFLMELLAVTSHTLFFFRADSGFFSGELLDYLEEQGSNFKGYLIKARNMRSVLEKQVWKKLKKKDRRKTGYHEATEFYYACDNWKKKRRFVALRRLVLKKLSESEKKKKKSSKKEEVPGTQYLPFNENEITPIMEDETIVDSDAEYKIVYEYACYVTSENLSPVRTHKRYTKRAVSETLIDEAKNQMGLGKLRTNNFSANAVIFQCSILAYNIIQYMCLLTKDKTLIRNEITTIRTFLIRVCGKLLVGSNQYRLLIPKDMLYKKQWELWIKYAS